MYISQDMRNVCFQKQRKIHIKIELLNFDFRIVDELSGVAIGSPSIAVDAESDIRRTCNIEMVIKDSSFDVQPGGKIWLDKYIRVWYGIEDIRQNNKIVWFNQGIYLINEPSYSYDAETRILAFEGVDLMAKLTGLRNGQLDGLSTLQIPQGDSIKESVTGLVNLAGFNNYIVTIREGEDTVPYDMDFDAAVYIYDILAELRDIYVTYQFYFDVDGVFHFEPIPTGDNLSPILTTDEMAKLVTSYDLGVSFENVKNYIEVYGMTYDVELYAHPLSVYSSEVTKDSDSVYTFSGEATLEDGDVIGGHFSNVDRESSISIKIGSGQTYPVKIYDYETDAHFAESETGYYMFEWNEENSCYLFYDGWGLYIDGNNYGIISTLPIELKNGDVVGFIAPSTLTNPGIKLNGSIVYPIMGEDRSQYAVLPDPNEYYVFEWEADNNRFYFIGYVQPRAIAYDNNPESPFYVGGTTGLIRLVCSGDEYDNISTNQLAQDRADFELYNYCRLQDTISLEMLPVPFLDVYDLINVRLPHHTEYKQYIIKNISTDLYADGIQSIEAYQYYPYYPEL